MISRNVLAAFWMLVILSAAPGAYAEGLYRWVDDKGRVHYGDQLPPQEVNKAYSIMNKRGATVQEVEAAKTAAQRAADERAARASEQEKRRLADNRNRDRVLLESYIAETEIPKTRDRHIATIDGLIKVAQHKIDNLRQQFSKLSGEAAQLERNGKSAPADLKADVELLRRQITEQEHYIASQKQQQQVLREKYAADLERYRELRAMENAAKSGR